jgi:hypothetical protein
LETVIREKQQEKRESSNNISNEAVKWRVKNKKKLYIGFFLLVFHAQMEKPNKILNKISFLFYICYSYISLKRVKTNKARSTKK